MSPNSASRVCLLALGVYLLVSGLATVMETFAQRPLVVSQDQISLPSVLTSIWVSASIAVVSATFFSFLPGAFILYRAHQWADRWFPEGASVKSETGTPSAYYAVGAAILGVYFSIVGVSSLIGGLAQAIFLSLAKDSFGFELSYASRSLASGAAYLAGGIWLTVFARRLVRSVA